MKIHIVGAGDTGRYLARELSDLKNDVILIDISPGAISSVEEKLDVMTATGDATCRSLLKSAGVEDSEMFVAVTGVDGVNILASALAAEMGARKTIARVDSPSFFIDQTGFERGLLKTTALACAPRLVSYEMVRCFRSQYVNQVRDYAENALTLSAVSVSKLHRDFTDSLNDVENLMDHGVCGVVRDGEFFGLSEIGGIYESDVAIILCPHSNFSNSLATLSQNKIAEKVIVIGGGDVGSELANIMSTDGHKVTVIDINRKQCEVLAERLSNITVVHGDGTNLVTLEEEGVQDMKAIFSVTKADEVNLMSSLLARDLGVDSTFALVHRPGYANVYKKLGVSATTSAHQLLFRTVDWMNSPAWVLQSNSFVTNRIEVVEIYIRVNSGLTDQPISGLGLPKGVTMLGGMVNGQFVRGSQNPRFIEGGYYLFIGPTGFGKDLDKNLTKVSKS